MGRLIVDIAHLPLVPPDKARVLGARRAQNTQIWVCFIFGEKVSRFSHKRLSLIDFCGRTVSRRKNQLSPIPRRAVEIFAPVMKCTPVSLALVNFENIVYTYSWMLHTLWVF